jgi:hypothetical protein
MYERKKKKKGYHGLCPLGVSSTSASHPQSDRGGLADTTNELLGSQVTLAVVLTTVCILAAF